MANHFPHIWGPIKESCRSPDTYHNRAPESLQFVIKPIIRSEAFNQAGRSGHLIFLAETPVISGWNEMEPVVLSKSNLLGADFKAWTTLTVKKSSISRGLGG
jgi:hypothetical protein